MTMMHKTNFIDGAAYKAPVIGPPRPYGSVSVDGFWIFSTRRLRSSSDDAMRWNRSRSDELAADIKAVRAKLACLRRGAPCDDRPHVGSKAALRMRLELIGLMVEHRIVSEGLTHMMPKALVLARQVADYEPTAFTVTHICYLYALCPRWLLMGEGEMPEEIPVRP